MKEAVRILGVRIDNLSQDEASDWLRDVLSGSPEQKFVATLNPEILLKASKDNEYCDILNSADLNVCDGFGIVLAGFLRGEKIKERYAGVDLVEQLLEEAKHKGLEVLVINARNALSSSAEIMGFSKSKHQIEIAVLDEKDEDLFEKEAARSAEIIFVNFGSPHQEKFIFENRKKFPSGKIFVGVGGAFDFYTGKFRRAPSWMRKAGLEWLWRLIQEPKRIFRIWNAVIVFPVITLLRKN